MTANTPAAEGFPLSPQQRAACLRGGFAERATRTVQVPIALAPVEIASRLAMVTAEHEILRTSYVEVAGRPMPLRVVDPPGPVVEEKTDQGDLVMRAGSLSVRYTPVPDGTRLELGLPRLSVDQVTWRLLLGLLLDGTPDTAAGGPPHYADGAARPDARLPWAEPPVDPRSDSNGVPFLSPVGVEEPGDGTWTVVIRPDDATLSALRTLAHRLQVSEPAVLLAAWASLRSRYTRSVDQPISVVTDGRAAPESRRVLGLLERPVSLRLPIGADAVFALAARTAEDALATAAAEEHLSDPSVRPETSFRYQWDPWFHSVEPEPAEFGDVPGRLHLDCWAAPEKLTLAVTATCGSTTRSDLSAYARAWELLLADALADPDEAVGRLLLTDQVEQQPPQPAPQDSVLLRFLRQADRVPGDPAVRCGEDVITYGQLAAWAESIASVLHDHGVRPGDQVPLLVPATSGTPAAILGCWLAGAAFVPLDPAWPRGRTEAILRQWDPELVLVPGTLEEFTGSVDAVPLPPCPPSTVTARPRPVGETDVAYVMFTSGTSGVPRGVVVGHAQLAHYAAASRSELDLRDGASVATVSTMAADLAYTAIFLPLTSGGCVRLVDADTAADPQMLAAEFGERPVEALKIAPSRLSALLAGTAPASGWLPTEVLVLGGESLPPGLAERVAELNPRLRVYNEYGPTETTIGASCRMVRLPVDPRCASVPVGTTLGGCALTVVDEAGHPVPAWVPGEVVISGPGVGIGYLDEVQAGRAGFGERGTRRYRSGDLGRLVPGAGVEVLGRLDDQVKLGDYRIELQEIEMLLLRQRSVEAAAVIARRDDGGLVTHLDAYVVRGDGYDGVQAEALKKTLGRQLPPALVPEAWQFLDALPLTRNGKVDRAALPPIEVRTAQLAGPRDAFAQRMSAVWSDVLGMEDISPDDDFYSLGGHSLHAIRLISRVKAAFGIELSMASVLSARTPAAMTALVRGGPSEGSPLVLLQPARDPGGPPIVCFHPGEGGTDCYAELAELLSAGSPVLGIESPGLHGGTPPATFVEMAQRHATAIVAAGHRAPVLVGWDLGGLVARETAAVLRRRGEPVTALILLDGPSPGLVGGEDEALAPAADTAASEDHPVAGHREPPEADHPVLLVRAGAVDAPPDQDWTWGWSSLGGPHLTVASIPTDYHGLLRPPAVAELADTIRGLLGSGSGSR
ncbi:AMP-binding protein [Micromonospora orduensis]|uniref:AMP-binding protein n=1 Tax=Micromonospora orduensis TaxID=1420891 RepID=A0A5C4QI63_9ACTN|nr:alpha/beta fold hydrolase [Micromonospora orduensis]TNH23991.1 AMP-binding protein [Micromonospora orduensis]